MASLVVSDRRSKSKRHGAAPKPPANLQHDRRRHSTEDVVSSEDEEEDEDGEEDEDEKEGGGSCDASSHDEEGDEEEQEEQEEQQATSSSQDANMTMDQRVPPRFRGKTLYAIFAIEPTAIKADISRAYRRQALSCHPDLNASATATAEFQYLSRCHEILSDPERRALYDESGSIEDIPSGLGGFANATTPTHGAEAYWHSVFPKVTVQGIESYRERYLGSETERTDLCAAYSKYDGDLECIFESVPFASASSVVRLCGLLNSLCHANISSAKLRKFARSLEMAESQEATEAAEHVAADLQARRSLEPAARARLLPSTNHSSCSSCTVAIQAAAAANDHMADTDNMTDTDLATQLRRRLNQRMKATRGILSLTKKQQPSSRIPK